MNSQTPQSLATQSQATTDMLRLQHGNYHFTAINLARIGTDAVAAVTLVVDISESVESFKDLLEKCLDSAVQACLLSPNHDQLQVRIVVFNHNVVELTGFLPLADLKSFVGRLQPAGATALVDGTLDGLHGIQGFAKALRSSDYSCNGTLIVLTDGEGNTGRERDPATIQALVTQMLEHDRALESLQMILVAVNAKNCAKALHKFHKEAGFNQFVDIGDATPQKLARLAQFISKSVSSSSQALGTGVSAQLVNPQSLGI